VNVLPSRSIRRVFVQPDDDIPVGRVVSETLEPLELVTERRLWFCFCGYPTPNDLVVRRGRDSHRLLRQAEE
jgi:hypothetical protein